MSPDFILDVNEADFEYEVVAYSKNTPVVVDFWATWCRPCHTLSPLLEKLTLEAAGS
ncbi:thioredoxin family protein, partial [Klebsiella pneumoniae]|uniref:thioredoxin family protein n=1 Tax=Klebsiella pneumoniae TaxID=573 RepID=UPI0034DEA1B3